MTRKATMARRHESFNARIEVKSFDTATGAFEGYLAVFNNTDHNGDICEPGCFKKTLTEAYEVKKRLGAAFLFPLLWMHDEDNPVGGFSDMSEDSHGLYVKGQCDLDTEWGRRAFSGMQKGYMSQLSIGYQAIRATRDQKGIRHLVEVRLMEGSTVTTGFAANSDALILQTKLRDRRLQTKGASGKTSWPLGERDATWDAGEAHGRIVAWATDGDNKLDQAKMKSVHFWYDDGAPENLGSYKLLFCDIKDGNPVAQPRAIFASAAALQGSRGGVDLPSGDVSAVQAKISAYYKRMAKEFDDDTLVAPWDEKKLALRRAVEEKGWGGVQTITSGLSNISYAIETIDMMLEMIGDVCGLNLDPDEGYEDEAGDVASQMTTSVIPGMAVQPAVQVLLDNLGGFKEGLLTLGNSFQDLDTTCDGVLALLGMNPDDYGYMSAVPMLSVKVSKTLSAASRATIQKAVDGIDGHSRELKDLLESADGDMATARRSDIAPIQRKSEPRATTSTETDPNGEPAIDDESATLDELHQMLFAQNVSARRLSMD